METGSRLLLPCALFFHLRQQGVGDAQCPLLALSFPSLLPGVAEEQDLSLPAEGIWAGGWNPSCTRPC